jgi:hypothetical protein
VTSIPARIVARCGSRNNIKGFVHTQSTRSVTEGARLTESDGGMHPPQDAVRELPKRGTYPRSTGDLLVPPLAVVPPHHGAAQKPQWIQRCGGLEEATAGEVEQGGATVGGAVGAEVGGAMARAVCGVTGGEGKKNGHFF